MSETESAELDADGWKKLRERLEWKYPHLPATREPAKASVSVLRRRLVEDDDAEAKQLFKFQRASAKFQIGAREGTRKLSAAETGTVHHTFLQLVSLDKVTSMAGLREEARRMELEEALTPDTVASLDFMALAAFWQSELGRQILAQGKHTCGENWNLRRGFSPKELPGARLTGSEDADNEYVVVQRGRRIWWCCCRRKYGWLILKRTGWS